MVLSGRVSPAWTLQPVETSAVSWPFMMCIINGAHPLNHAASVLCAECSMGTATCAYQVACGEECWCAALAVDVQREGATCCTTNYMFNGVARLAALGTCSTGGDSPAGLDWRSACPGVHVQRVASIVSVQRGASCSHWLPFLGHE
jgi:hypothetical protein